MGIWFVRPIDSPGLAGLELTLLGRGEQALGQLRAIDNGLRTLWATTGTLGVSWLVAGLILALVYFLRGQRKAEPSEKRRAICWSAAAALAAGAMLARGGLYIPSVTLAVALTWGLLPLMAGRVPTHRSGVWVLAMLAAAMLLLGLLRNGGLAAWMAEIAGQNDFYLHLWVGFLLALAVAWLTGAKQILLGLLGIALAALAGGIGEILQGLLTLRSEQFSDWIGHSVGCAMALPPYLLCMMSRWCESADVKPNISRPDSTSS